jgi:hypothetical protein
MAETDITGVLALTDRLREQKMNEGLGQGLANAAGKALYKGAQKVLGSDITNSFMAGKNGQSVPAAQPAPAPVAQPAQGAAQPQAAPAAKPAQVTPTQASPQAQAPTQPASTTPQVKSGILSGIANKISGAFKPDGGLNKFLSSDQKVAQANKDLFSAITPVITGVQDAIKKAQEAAKKPPEQKEAQTSQGQQPAAPADNAQQQKVQEALAFTGALDVAMRLREAVDNNKVIEQVSTIMKNNVMPLVKKIKANQPLSADETKYLNGSLGQIANIKMFSGLKKSIGTVTQQLKGYEKIIAEKEQEAQQKGITDEPSTEKTDGQAQGQPAAPDAQAAPQGNLSDTVTKTLDQMEKTVKTLESIQLTPEQAQRAKTLAQELYKRFNAVNPNQ